MEFDMRRRQYYPASALILCLTGNLAMAQSAANAGTEAQANETPVNRPNVSSTSNTTKADDTLRDRQLEEILVSAKASSLSLGGGLMSVQTAPKAVSTISRDAIIKAAPGSNFTQVIDSIPGVNATTDDVSGLSDGKYSIRGFDSTEIGVTINGAPINNAGSYSVFATEYGDTENIGDITVLQGLPDVDMPNTGNAGGHIAWATIDPSHHAGVDLTQSGGSNSYERTFVRLNTGDIGPVRSWLSWSHNKADKWRGAGTLDVAKVDGKSIWTIDDKNSISASLQYNREFLDAYLSPTKAQVAANGYYYDYTTAYTAGSLDTNYWKLHTQPFKSATLSMDGEFTLRSNLRLSVVPYFIYGTGGGGTGNSKFTETTSTVNTYLIANQDLNGDGSIIDKTKSLTYAFSNSGLNGPGIIAKFNQDLTSDDSLGYGVWWERSRMLQNQTFGLVDMQNGQPESNWAKADLALYPDGTPQKSYEQYTVTDSKKVFVTDRWTPSDKWAFEAGVAYLYVTRDGSLYQYPDSTAGANPQYGRGDISASYHDFTPALGVSFLPNGKNQFFYGIGKSFRPPPNKAVFNNVLIGKGSNQSETAWTNDLGWRYYGDRFSASAMIFRSNFDNKTESGTDQVTGLTYYTQIPNLRMQGFNAESSYSITDTLKVYGSYTLTQATIESKLDGGSSGIYPTAGKTLFNTPRNLLDASLNYDSGPLWASLSAKYRGPIYGDYMNTERVGGYTTLTLNAGYRFPDWHWLQKSFIKLNCSNIANRRAFTNANNASAFLTANTTGIKDDNGVTLGASAPTYSLLEPRTFMVTVGGSLF
jgi:iron complex outermembrane receptor protein